MVLRSCVPCLVFGAYCFVWICCVKATAQKSGDNEGYQLNTLHRMEEDIQHLKSLTTSLAEKVEKSEQQNLILRESLRKLEEENDHFKKHKFQQDNFVAFQARIHTARSYIAGDTVIFDLELFDEGDAFNPDLSVFQCPISGYYLFFVNLRTADEDKFEAAIVIDGSSKYPRAISDAGESSGSNMVIRFCSEGQAVWVDAKLPGDLNGSVASSFTGVLLK